MLLLLSFAVAAVLSLADADCEIDPFSQNPGPIIVNSGLSEFIYPSYGDSTLKFTINAAVEFLCPGGYVVISGAQSEFAIAEATCVSSSTFLIDGKKVTWSEIKCSKNPVNTAQYTGQTCTEGGKEAEIGFNVGDGRFLRAIRICFDDVTENTIYSNYNLTSTIGQKKTGTARPSFSQGTGFYNIGSNTVNQLYTRSSQTSTLNSLLGLDASDTTYIKTTGDYFLSRGHLTARGDLFYPYLENATFYYINAAPQWQTFNAGNWETVESDVTAYASAKGLDLQVWTGTYGVATLPHKTTGKAVPLYLYTSGSTYGIPVPEIYWKLIYNPTNKKGVVLVGMNNPYQSGVTSSSFCEDQSDSLSWLTWKKDDILKGYSFACTIPDFKKIVKTVPNLTVTGLLQ